MWSEVGVVARNQKKLKNNKMEQLAKQYGIEAINSKSGRLIFKALFNNPHTQVGVIPINWETFQEMSYHQPLLSDIYAQRPTRESTLKISVSNDCSDPGINQVDIVEQLDNALPEEKKNLIIRVLRQQVAEVLSMRSEQDVDIKKGFFDQGMDSLTSMDLQKKLQKLFDCKLSSTVIFKHASVEQLSNHLYDILFSHNEVDIVVNNDGKNAFAAEAPNGILNVEDVENLSEEQLEELIFEEYSNLN